MRLIDADALKEVIRDNPYLMENLNDDNFECILDLIDNAPTVEPETYITGEDYDLYMRGYKQARKDFERPQGEWFIKTGVVSNYSACSLCDFADYRHLHFNYCPGCGARMSFGGKLCGGES